MIISRTPHRISFFGGGTDYPEYYLEHGGRVLGAAIDKYSYLNVRRLPPFFEHKHRIVYSKQESVASVDEIQHPSVRETLRHLGVQYGVSIHHDGDIPARSGMGSSSAFTVGLLKSMMALEGRYISDQDLAKQAIYIEQQLIRENVGSQDQVFAAYGGFNVIDFLSNGEIRVEPVFVSQERLERFESSWMLIFSGLSRTASEVAGEQIRNTSKNISYLNDMKSLVSDALAIISNESRDLKEFGILMNETWRLKRSLSSRISSPDLDNLYESAVRAGAVGGKLLGAGGGGFMLFYVEPEAKEHVRKALNGYLEVPFKFDFDGSKIIVYQPEHNDF